MRVRSILLLALWPLLHSTQVHAAIDYIQPSSFPSAALYSRIGLELSTSGIEGDYFLPRGVVEFAGKKSAIALSIERRIYRDHHFSYSYFDERSSAQFGLTLRTLLNKDENNPKTFFFEPGFAILSKNITMRLGSTLGWELPRTTLQVYFGLMTGVAFGNDEQEYLGDQGRFSLRPEIGASAAFALLEKWGLYVTAETKFAALVLEKYFDSEPEESTRMLTWSLGPGMALVTPWFDMNLGFHFIPLRIVSELYEARKPSIFRFSFLISYTF